MEIAFDKAKFDKLQKAYNKAVKENKTEFKSLGRDWVTKYAKYVLEFLSPRFKNMK